jgi:exportin-2 (importin alpha re-exporter)
MLAFFLSPAFWEAQGNVPALVKLLQTYFVKGSKDIVAKDQLRPVLGVAHKLISSRMNDQFGFELLTSLFECVST